MANIYSYKCKKCGWSIKTSPLEKAYTMMGGFFTFVCKECKEVFDCDFDIGHESEIDTRCPTCGSENTISWKPSNGCPKCGEKLEKDKDFSLILD